MFTTWTERMRREYGEPPKLSKRALSLQPPQKLLAWAIRQMVHGYYHMMRKKILDGVVPKRACTFASQVPDIEALVTFIRGSTPVDLFTATGAPYLSGDEVETSDGFLFGFYVCRGDVVAHRLIVRLPLEPKEVASGPDMAHLRKRHKHNRNQIAAAGGSRTMSDRDCLLAMEGKCNVCKQDATTRCSACHHVYYCCAAHQKSDWKFHKVTCIMTKAIRSKSSAADALAAAGLTETDKKMALSGVAMEHVTMEGFPATVVTFKN